MSKWRLSEDNGSLRENVGPMTIYKGNCACGKEKPLHKKRCNECSEEFKKNRYEKLDKIK